MATIGGDSLAARQETSEFHERGVRLAISDMYSSFGASRTLREMAGTAFMSQFHFVRVFGSITGSSPMRFLNSIRIQEAKRLLVVSDESVTDVSFSTGYSSVGTFTRTFTEYVGVSPTSFRKGARLFGDIRLKVVADMLNVPERACVSGGIHLEVSCECPLDLVVAALFSTPIPRATPIECVCSSAPGKMSFGARSGSARFIFAIGATCGATLLEALLCEQSRVLVGSLRLFGSETSGSITLRQREWMDPPIVTAFPLLMMERLGLA